MLPVSMWGCVGVVSGFRGSLCVCVANLIMSQAGCNKLLFASSSGMFMWCVCTLVEFHEQICMLAQIWLVLAAVAACCEGPDASYPILQFYNFTMTSKRLPLQCTVLVQFIISMHASLRVAMTCSG